MEEQEEGRQKTDATTLKKKKKGVGRKASTQGALQTWGRPPNVNSLLSSSEPEGVDAHILP